MAELFTVGNFFTLLMLVLLQAVLGFDNLLYISLESRRAPADKQKFVRKLGIALAIFLRIGLLFLLVALVDKVKATLFTIPENPFVSGEFNLYSLITLAGGAFIIYTAIKEVFHLIMIEEANHAAAAAKPKSVGAVIFWIVLMNCVFSFDSILSAMALTDVLPVMATAIIIGGILMIWLADKVADFLQKNRMYEVLGLFILLIVGIMLLSEGGHLAHLSFFGHAIEPMTKSTFYFVIAVLVIIDLVQGRYQRRLLAEKENRTAQSSTSEHA